MLPANYTTRSIIALAVPILVGNLAQTLITFVDTAFLGHLGMVELGAAMMAGLYYYVFSTLAWGFATGIQIIVARRFGENNLTEVGAVFKHGLLVVLALSLLLFCLLHFCTDVLLKGIISSPDILQYSEEFMKYRHYGIIFVCFNFLFRAFYVGLSDTRIIIYTTFLMAVVNIFFDYALIFGNFGMPEMGVSGAAIASVLAEASALIFFVFYTLFRIPLHKYGLLPMGRFHWPLVSSIVKISLPTMGQRLVSFGAWFVFFVMIERTGELAVAVSGIVRSAYMVILVPVFAFSATANTLTSRIIGEGHSDAVPHLLRRILKICLAFLVVLVAVCAIFPDTIAAIYTDDAMLAAASVPSLWVVCGAALLMSGACILFEAVSGTGKTLMAFLLESAILVVYIGYILLVTKFFPMPVEVIWCAEVLYALLLGTVSYAYLRRGKWQGKEV
ncbi:MAG: MATE family efflux transporter [Bacteroidales bacterium]|nr:MATE family efflux transporter [Bacteroidales bacterium]